MSVTISVTCGNSGMGLGTGAKGKCEISFEHNSRQKELVAKEAHIIPDGMHEDWLEEESANTAEEFAERFADIFAEPVENHNAKQTRKDRMINDYLIEKIRGHKAGKEYCHECYEIIAMVGNKLDESQEMISDTVGECLLEEYFRGDESLGIKPWEERNPQMILVGCFYHADEINSNAHLHIDFVPVGYGYQNGMEMRLSLGRALKASLNTHEIEGSKESEEKSAFVKWINSEKELLEKICRSYGLDVIHPDRDAKAKIEAELEAEGRSSIREYVDLDGTRVREKTIVKTVHLPARKNKELMETLDKGGKELSAMEARKAVLLSTPDLENIHAKKELDRSGRETGNVVIPEAEYKSLVATAKAAENVQEKMEIALQTERRAKRQEKGMEREQQIRWQKSEKKVDEFLQTAQRICRLIPSPIGKGHSLWDDLVFLEKAWKRRSLNEKMLATKIEEAYQKEYKAREEAERGREKNREKGDDIYRC